MEHPLRQEFQPCMLSLGHPCPGRFSLSQWTDRRSIFVVWILVWALGLAALTIGSGVDFEVNGSDTGAKWFVSFGHWTLLLTAFAALLDLLNAVCCRRTSDSSPIDAKKSEAASAATKSDDVLFHAEFTLLEGIDSPRTPCGVQLVWLLFSISNSLNIVWTVVFWAVDYNDSSSDVDIISSIVPTAFVVSNVLFSAKPVQILHAVYPVVAGVAYVAFLVVYEALGGKRLSGSGHDTDDVFPGIDWDSAFPTTLTVGVGLLVVVPLCHLVTFALYTFRVYVFSRVHCSSSSYSLSQVETDASSSPEGSRETADQNKASGSNYPRTKASSMSESDVVDKVEMSRHTPSHETTEEQDTNALKKH